MSKFADYYFISWVAVYSNGKTEYYNDKIAIDYEYPDEIVTKAEEYINRAYFYADTIGTDISVDITLLSVCKLT